MSTAGDQVRCLSLTDSKDATCFCLLCSAYSAFLSLTALNGQVSYPQDFLAHLFSGKACLAASISMAPFYRSAQYLQSRFQWCHWASCSNQAGS